MSRCEIGASFFRSCGFAAAETDSGVGLGKYRRKRFAFRLGGRTQIAQADAAGKWKVTFEPMEATAAAPLKLKVTSPSENLTIKKGIFTKKPYIT